jgi:uncharacterized membrane protein YkgB
MTFRDVDVAIVHYAKKCSPYLARVALFIVFFWFGVLKIIGTSPANDLVEMLQVKTLPFLASAPFIGFLGSLEIAIAFLVLFPQWERLTFGLLVLHMVATFLPLVFLPDVTWQGFLTPTLEGQYILKNLVIVALAAVIAAYLSPLYEVDVRGTNERY